MIRVPSSASSGPRLIKLVQTRHARFRAATVQSRDCKESVAGFHTSESPVLEYLRVGLCGTGVTARSGYPAPLPRGRGSVSYRRRATLVSEPRLAKERWLSGNGLNRAIVPKIEPYPRVRVADAGGVS